MNKLVNLHGGKDFTGLHIYCSLSKGEPVTVSRGRYNDLVAHIKEILGPGFLFSKNDGTENILFAGCPVRPLQ